MTIRITELLKAFTLVGIGFVIGLQVSKKADSEGFYVKGDKTIQEPTQYFATKLTRKHYGLRSGESGS